MLTLLKRVELGRPLGSTLHLQLDNTTGENKNATVLGFMALLVHWGVFAEAILFFMPKGHTFNLLDQTFGPLINAMKARVMATMSDLLEMMHQVRATAAAIIGAPGGLDRPISPFQLHARC